jgi:hypothetical protein
MTMAVIEVSSPSQPSPNQTSPDHSPVNNSVNWKHVETHIILELLLEINFRGDRGRDSGGEEGKEKLHRCGRLDQLGKTEKCP